MWSAGYHLIKPGGVRPAHELSAGCDKHGEIGYDFIKEISAPGGSA